jgi:two-component system response regulator FixJ
LIADNLGVSVRVVEIHRANIMAKMEATSLLHLVRTVLIAER